MNQIEKDFHSANHQQDAEHCAQLSKCFSKSADAHAALAKGLEVKDPDASAGHESIASAHKAAAASCVEAGQHHVAACEKIAAMPTNEGTGSDGTDRGSSELKAVLDAINKLGGLPGGASSIPTSDRPRVVIRNGQPDRTEKVTLDPELQGVIFDEKQARG
jgi:hypothetical protein